jgi:hypothetical protein
MRSPLQINTSKSVSILKKIIPKGSSVSSFFFYDGTVEIALASAGRSITSRTNKYAVYEFWTCIMKEAKSISKSVKFMHDRLSEAEMYLLQENWLSYKTPHDRSTFFYILNRCSDKNYASHGSINKLKLTPLTILNLQKFEIDNFNIIFDRNADPIKDLSVIESDFLYMPMGKYTHNLFDRGKSVGSDMFIVDHKKARAALEKINKKWVLVYNKHPAVFELYKNKNIIMIDGYGNKTIDRDKCREIIINNFVSI